MSTLYGPKRLAILAAALLTVASTTVATAEDWEYSATAGGAIDREAGRVWGALNSTLGGSGDVSWGDASQGCSQYGMTAYQVTGLYTTGWRMPTLGEAQLAASHNAWSYFNAAWGEGDPACWTSTKQSSSAWALQFFNGASALLHSKNGRANFRPVRPVESWTYRPDLGGWLDNQSGLVWGKTSGELLGWSSTWNGVPTTLASYRTATAIVDWRSPTLEEAQEAIAHNAIGYFQQTDAYPAAHCWTSTEAGRQQLVWCVRFHSGASIQTSKQSAIFIRPVYRP